MRKSLYRSVALLAALALILPPPSVAQTDPPPAATVNAFNTEQLDALLAPIALYPDALLAQVLMAATYPLQPVEASRWLDVPANKALTGDALTQALEKQSWDPSVKSLVPFPQVLVTLNDKLDWTQQLGYACATQQSDVMDSVVLVVGSLWRWARPTWYGYGAGNVNANVNRYNNINVNRPPINSAVWRPRPAASGPPLTSFLGRCPATRRPCAIPSVR